MEFSLGRAKFPLVFHHFGSCFNIPFFSNILCNLNLVLDFMLEFSFTINLANIDVAAFDIQIYFNNELLEYNMHPNYNGKTVAVVGGGNVAMDCARTIKRLGNTDSDYNKD